MNISAYGWIILVLSLCVSTFGASCVVAIILGFLSFIIGLLTLLYIQSGNFEETYFSCNLLNNPLAVQDIPPGGLPKIVESIKKPKTAQKTDQRVTGSDLIDSSLQEIFGYIIRDYVHPWYNLISDDTDFVEDGVRKSAQTLAIHISNRVKEIDWLPYLTTRLVDDFAVHIRLFRSALSSLAPAPNSPKHLSAPHHRRNKSDTSMSTTSSDSSASKSITSSSVEQRFFSLEAEACSTRGRGAVCLDTGAEEAFLAALLEVLMYVVLKDEDFKCGAVRTLMGELAAKGIVKALVDLIVDPDTINQAILWLCGSTLSSDMFLTALRSTSDLHELRYTRDLVTRELQALRGRDTTATDASVRQQISSLQYVLRLIDTRLAVVNSCSAGGGAALASTAPPAPAAVHLSLDTLLKNNVALSYFIDYVQQTGQEKELFFYLATEGWRVAAEQHLASVHLGETIDVSLLRESGRRICSQYLPALQLPGPVARALQARVHDPAEPPSERWFDDAQRWAYETLRAAVPGFERSPGYAKLLQDLVEDVEVVEKPQRAKHARSYSDITSTSSTLVEEDDLSRLKSGNFTISVDIIEAGVMSERGKTFGIYATQVTHVYLPSGHVRQHHIYRRYSDFHELQCRVRERHPDLGRLPFPGKKPFQTAERALLERRMIALNHYMAELCRTEVVAQHPGLRELLVTFTREEEQVGPAPNTTRDEGPDNNIPLRVLLTLADEVFDLKSRNQWLRRRLVTLLRQIVRAWFGDIVTRRIVEWVADNTSPRNVARALKNVQRAVWPGGVRAPARPRRSEAARARTRLAAKVALLSAPALSDELQRLLGQDTTRQGLLTVFDLVQRPPLTRRLLYVVLEGALQHLMPEKPIAKIFKTLYAAAQANNT